MQNALFHRDERVVRELCTYKEMRIPWYVVASAADMAYALKSVYEILMVSVSKAIQISAHDCSVALEIVRQYVNSKHTDQYVHSAMLPTTRKQ